MEELCNPKIIGLGHARDRIPGARPRMSPMIIQKSQNQSGSESGAEANMEEKEEAVVDDGSESGG